MKRAIILVVAVALLTTIARLAISPASYLLVWPNAKSSTAFISVNDQRAIRLPGFAGLYFARVSAAEGKAQVTIFLGDKAVERCVLGYFTSFEIQPRVLSNEDCRPL